MSIDLTTFCSTSRPQVDHPFTVGGHTYYTDGYIAVRVPAIEGTPTDGPENVATYFDGMDAVEYRHLPSFVLPPGGKFLVTCEDCDGTGKCHECPDCHCQCDRCNGTGKEERDSDDRNSVTFNGVNYGLTIFRRVLVLPTLRFETKPRERDVTRFRFDGGEGIVMPLIGTYQNHTDLGTWQ